MLTYADVCWQSKAMSKLSQEREAQAYMARTQQEMLAKLLADKDKRADTGGKAARTREACVCVKV